MLPHASTSIRYEVWKEGSDTQPASEIPTARLRALNVAMGAATQWLFNFIIARTVLTMQVTMGTAGYVSRPCLLTGLCKMHGC